MDFKCYHLYHDKAPIDPNYYMNNLKILQNFKNFTDEDLKRLIMQSIPKIGMKNKYDTF